VLHHKAAQTSTAELQRKKHVQLTWNIDTVH
jgi:hypothetical protein